MLSMLSIVCIWVFFVINEDCTQEKTPSIFITEAGTNLLTMAIRRMSQCVCLFVLSQMIVVILVIICKLWQWIADVFNMSA